MTGVLVVDALLLEHGEHNTGDCFDNGEFEPKLNLDLFCLEWRVDVGTFFCVLRVVSVGSVWENLWNLLLHFDHYLHCNVNDNEDVPLIIYCQTMAVRRDRRTC